MSNAVTCYVPRNGRRCWQRLRRAIAQPAQHIASHPDVDNFPPTISMFVLVRPSEGFGGGTSTNDLILTAKGPSHVRLTPPLRATTCLMLSCPFHMFWTGRAESKRMFFGPVCLFVPAGCSLFARITPPVRSTVVVVTG